MVRLFIGVMVPEDLKDYVISLQKRMERLVEAKFVEKENLHISLSFLGDVSETEVGTVVKKLDDVCAEIKKFEVKMTGLKFIPNINFLRVITLDVASPDLSKLSERIKTEIGGDVKPPHLTLCRVKKIIDRNKLVGISTGELSVVIQKISLVESELGRDGPTYSVVHDALLS